MKNSPAYFFNYHAQHYAIAYFLTPDGIFI